MANKRDDFKKVTTDILPKRVGYLCSNPTCRKLTIGANEIEDKATSIGIAAHITAAASGGPRYDDTLSYEERIHINNAIWLCNSCATLIDKDKKKYTTEILQNWKKQAEEETRKKLNGEFKEHKIGVPYLEADLVWKNGGRWHQGYSRKNPTENIDGREVYVIAENPIIYWDLEWKFKFFIYNNSSFPAYDISVESIGSEHFSHIDKLEKINNLPPFQNIDLSAKYSFIFEGTGKDANEITKHKIPENFENFKLRIKYYDEERNEHNTYLEIKNGELINTK